MFDETDEAYRMINLPLEMTKPRQALSTFCPIRLMRGAEVEALSARTISMPSVDGSESKARVVLKTQQLVGSLTDFNTFR